MEWFNGFKEKMKNEKEIASSYLSTYTYLLTYSIELRESNKQASKHVSTNQSIN